MGIYFSSIFFWVDILYIAVFILYMVGIQRRKQPVKGIWKKWRYKQHIYSTWGSNFGDGDGDILRQHHSPWVPLFVTRAVSLGDPWVASRKKGPCWAPLWGLLQSSPNWWWCSCCKVDFVHIHCVQTVLDWVSASNTMRQCRASCFQPQESVPLIRFLLYDLYGLFFIHKMCILQFHRYEPGIHCHKSACIYLGKFQRNLTNMRQHRWRLARPLWITSF